MFGDLFKTTFEGARLVILHPFGRALAVLPAEQQEAIAKANKANTDIVVDLIRENTWIGQDFLLLLTYLTATGSNFKDIAAYVGEKMSLIGESEGSVQKITAAGPMNQFAEIRTALREGKALSGGKIYIEDGDSVYSLMLNAETFRFQSLRTPAVKLEKDDTADPDREREAVFFEKMHLLQTAFSLFDNLLREYLELRLSPTWNDVLADIRRWTEDV
jgi:hypothetical protein